MNGSDNLLDAPVTGAPLPRVRNHTGFPSQYYQMADTQEQIFHVMVSRLTYDMRRIDAEGVLQLAQQQHPLVEADLFYGEPNASAVLQESDFAPYKPRCDVLFTHAIAHSPGGKSQRRWPVSVRIGGWEKILTVTGPRLMERRLLTGWRLSEPEPALRVPVRYEHAWGGTRQWPQAPESEAEFLERDAHNPIGCGFAPKAWLKKSRVRKIAAPSIECFRQPFTARDAARQRYPVVGLGAIGRHWQPRLKRAGTYDEDWKSTRWPRLPLDFDFSYWNCAPEDQQIDYPQGGEEVVLTGLRPEGELRFRLPCSPLKLLLHLEAGVPLFKPLVADTLVFDLAACELALVQRALVSAAAGVAAMELGAWDIKAAREANARILRENPHGS